MKPDNGSLLLTSSPRAAIETEPTSTDYPAKKGEGLIVKALSGFYYVMPDEGRSKPLECRARGIFKKEGSLPW